MTVTIPPIGETSSLPVGEQIVEAFTKAGLGMTFGRFWRMLCAGEASLFIHPKGSFSVQRLSDGSTCVVHLWGEWDKDFVLWVRKRLPENVMWRGRPGWRRYLRIKGVI